MMATSLHDTPHSPVLLPNNERFKINPGSLFVRDKYRVIEKEERRTPMNLLFNPRQ